MSSVLIVLAVAALAAPQLLAEPADPQDPLIVSARDLSQQGNHDSAIAMLRSALASRPDDDVLKRELVRVLSLKHQQMSLQLAELNHEIAALRGTMSATPAPARIPCGAGVADPVRVGGNLRMPRKLHDAEPVYPPKAREARVTGLVIVEALIDCDGSVSDVRVLRGQPLLNDAAVEAVSQWRYSPTLLNGVPVPVIITATVTFTLDE